MCWNVSCHVLSHWLQSTGEDALVPELSDPLSPSLKLLSPELFFVSASSSSTAAPSLPLARCRLSPAGCHHCLHVLKCLDRLFTAHIREGGLLLLDRSLVPIACRQQFASRLFWASMLHSPACFVFRLKAWATLLMQARTSTTLAHDTY